MTRTRLGCLVTAMVAGGWPSAVAAMGRPLASIAPTRRRLGWTRLRGSGGAAGSGRDAAGRRERRQLEPGASPEAEGSRQRPRLRRPAASPDLQGPQEPEAPRAPAAQQSPAVLPVRAPPLLQGVLAARVAPAAVAARPSTGSPDASAEKPPAIWGTPCSSQDDCEPSPGLYLTCHTPGESSGCGACRAGLATARATLTVFAMAVHNWYHDL